MLTEAKDLVPGLRLLGGWGTIALILLRQSDEERERLMATLETSGLRDGYAELSEVRLHHVEAGDGPLVVLLHGFPEFWFSWRFQIPALAAAGFRVVAPDMRGYNLSSRPVGVAAYDVDR